jgi:hypothetical protein
MIFVAALACGLMAAVLARRLLRRPVDKPHEAEPVPLTGKERKREVMRLRREAVATRRRDYLAEKATLKRREASEAEARALAQERERIAALREAERRLEAVESELRKRAQTMPPVGRDALVFKALESESGGTLVAALYVPRTAARCTADEAILFSPNDTGVGETTIYKSRADCAYVIALRDFAGREHVVGQSCCWSLALGFRYRVGTLAIPDGYDDRKQAGCSQGINVHYTISGSCWPVKRWCYGRWPIGVPPFTARESKSLLARGRAGYDALTNRSSSGGSGGDEKRSHRSSGDEKRGHRIS